MDIAYTVALPLFRDEVIFKDSHAILEAMNLPAHGALSRRSIDPTIVQWVLTVAHESTVHQLPRTAGFSECGVGIWKRPFGGTSPHPLEGHAATGDSVAHPRQCMMMDRSTTLTPSSAS